MFLSRSVLYRIISLLMLLPFVFAGFSACGSGGGKVSAQESMNILLVHMDGVFVMKAGEGDWSEAEYGMILSHGDKVKTNESGQATITFFDGSIIELEASTEIELSEISKDEEDVNGVIRLKQNVGETFSKAGKLVDSASQYEIETPSAVAAVRGTVMYVFVGDNGQSLVGNVEGQVSVTAKGKEVSIPESMQSLIEKGQAPGEPQEGVDIPPYQDTAISRLDGLTGVEVTVSGKSGWQDTGVSLKNGYMYYIVYKSGGWTIDYRNYDMVGVEGYDFEVTQALGDYYKEAVGAPYAALLGRSGSGLTQIIGDTLGPYYADADGNLFLRMNDKDVSLPDNDGEVTVQVFVVVRARK